MTISFPNQCILLSFKYQIYSDIYLKSLTLFDMFSHANQPVRHPVFQFNQETLVTEMHCLRLCLWLCSKKIIFKYPPLMVCQCKCINWWEEINNRRSLNKFLFFLISVALLLRIFISFVHPHKLQGNKVYWLSLLRQEVISSDTTIITIRTILTTNHVS